MTATSVPHSTLSQPVESTNDAISAQQASSKDSGRLSPASTLAQPSQPQQQQQANARSAEPRIPNRSRHSIPQPAVFRPLLPKPVPSLADLRALGPHCPTCLQLLPFQPASQNIHSTPARSNGIGNFGDYPEEVESLFKSPLSATLPQNSSIVNGSGKAGHHPKSPAVRTEK